MTASARRVGDELYLGVDLGSSDLKVAAYGATGRCAGVRAAAHRSGTAGRGVAEQSPEGWWAALREAMNGLGASVDVARVAAVCIVGQSPTLVCVDASGAPLRPAITWADRRAQAQARTLAEALGASAMAMEFDILPRAMWVRDAEPDVFARVRWLFQAFDYLAFRLTGLPVTVETIQGRPPWTPERLERAGIDPERVPPEVLPPGRVIGPIDASVADELGLRPDVVVVSGMVDSFATWVGAGLTDAGRMCDIGGTSEGASLAVDGPVHDPQERFFGIGSPFGTGWVVGGSMTNGGSVLDWIVASLHGGERTRSEVLEALGEVEPVPDGLLALPYLRGERTPVYDPDIGAGFVGVRQRHDARHLGRALLEGVAFGLRQIVELLDDLGAPTREIVVTGGTSRAEVWNRIKADVTKRTLRPTEVAHAGTLGAAILARSGVESLRLAEVARAMVRYLDPIEPRPDASAIYDDAFGTFTRLHGALAPLARRSGPDHAPAPVLGGASDAREAGAR